MCGLFGFQWVKAPDKAKARILVSVLTAEMDHRGGDSWGWYSSDGQTMHHRGRGELSRSGQAMTMAKRQSVIAHTRRATTGHVKKENCHPFALETLVGAHNGIVSNHEALNAAYNRKCSVDSQHIFHHLEEQAPLDEIEAYGAIAWQLKAEPDAIRLGRFNGGELSVVSTQYGLIFASTLLAISRAIALAGMGEFTSYQVDDGPEYLANDGELFVTERKLGFEKPTYYRNWKDGFNGCEKSSSLASWTSSDPYEYDEETERWKPRNTYLERMSREEREERQFLESHGWNLDQD